MATVLVVDDEAANRDLLHILLRDRGHDVIEADTAVQALELIQIHHPELIITDALMPGMDGYELTRAVRTDPSSADIAVVVFSGNYRADEMDGVAGACGANRVVAKSPDPRELLETVDELLANPTPLAAVQPAELFTEEHLRTVKGKLVEKARQLRHTEETFTALAACAPVGILLTNPDGDATYVNAALTQIMAVPVDELLGVGWLSCFSPELHDEVLAQARGQRRPEVEHHRLRVIRPDGTHRWLNTHLKVIFDGNQRPAATIGIIDDVTAAVDAEERRQAAERRRALDDAQRLTDRLDSLRRMAGGIAHDFNNILATLLAYGEFLEETITQAAGAHRLAAELADALRADLEPMLAAGRRGHDLTRQLLLFGSRAPVSPTPVNVAEVVRAQVDLLSQRVADQFSVDVRLGAHVRDAMATVDHVEQIVHKLTTNAIEAMAGGGTLRIEVDNQDIAGEEGRTPVTQHQLPPGRYVRLTIGDTGAGMTPEVAEHAIEPFFTTKEAGQTAGLGLPTAYGAVRQLGGDLTIESQPGRGTRVHVLLPATPEVTSEPPATVAPRTEARRGTILVVDDDAAVRQLVVRILEKAGYPVLAASNGPDALALAEEHEHPIACLVTDVIMPHMLGSELARRLNARRPDTPVLYMSGYADPMLSDDHTDDSPTVLAKPFTHRELITALRNTTG